MRYAKNLVLMFLVALVPQLADAAIVQYDDRATWLAAIGGTPDVEEDFSGFAADTDFRPEPITVMTALGTLGQIGTDEAFRNLVEVPPFTFTDNNGTNHASCFTNFPEGANPGTMIEHVFTDALDAWGADFSSAAGGEVLSIDVIEDGSGSILASLLIASNGNPQFLGFVGDAGEQVGSIILRSTNLNAGGAGKGFGMDNLAGRIAFVAPPQPPVLEIPTVGQLGLVALVLLLGAASLVLLRRRA